MSLKKPVKSQKSKQTGQAASVQQELQQPQLKKVEEDQAKIHYLKRLQKLKVNGPTLIEVEGGVTVYVDQNNCVTIQGQNNVKISTPEDLLLDAKNIDIKAKESVYIGSDKHIIQQSPRIDLNPEMDKGGYSKNAKRT